MAGYIGTQAVSVNTTSATISDDLAVGDDLTVTDDAAIGGTLAVTGVATFTATPVFSADVTIEDDLFLDSDSATIHFGEDGEVKLFHVADIGLQLTGSGLNSNFTLAAYHTTDGTVPDLKLAKSGSNTIGTNAATADGEALGQIRFAGVDTSGDSRTAVTMSVAQVGTASGAVAGTLALDVATGITQYKKGGTEFLRISESSGDAVIQSTVQDERIFFSGDDSGSGVNALILDFALAGDATFSRNVGISMSGEAIDTRLHIDACPDNKVITFEQSGRKSCIGTLYAANSTGSRLDFHISNGNQNGGNVNRMTINASGDVQIIDGNLTVAAGHGIVFGVDGTGAGADASELLDDYEEGQWTPAPTRTSSAPTVGFSAGPNGSYVKVGRMVYASFDMTINSYSGGGGTAQLNGLPYAASSDLNSFSGFGVLIVRDSSAIPVGPTATTIVKGFVERGASHISVQYDNIGNAGSNTNSNVANFQQGRFTGYMMYPASS